MLSFKAGKPVIPALYRELLVLPAEFSLVNCLRRHISAILQKIKWETA